MITLGTDLEARRMSNLSRRDAMLAVLLLPFAGPSISTAEDTTYVGIVVDLDRLEQPLPVFGNFHPCPGATDLTCAEPEKQYAEKYVLSVRHNGEELKFTAAEIWAALSNAPQFTK